MRGQARRGPVLFSFRGKQAPETICQRPVGPGGIRNSPRYPYQVAEVEPVGFVLGSRSTREPPSKPKPRPRRAMPRHAERTEGEGGGATGRRRQGRRRRPPRGPTAPEARSEAEGPPGPGAGAGQRAHGPERAGTTNISRARRSVVFGAESWGGTTTPPQGCFVLCAVTGGRRWRFMS